MKVFISWSGQRSKVVAETLRDWLPDVIQSVEPWMSAADIEAGARWSRDVAEQLEGTKFGILCLTRENQVAPWILFEAGALAKTVANTFVCPYLIGLEPNQVEQGPLTQFQAKRANEIETRQLISTINKALKDDALTEERLNRTFARAWPELKKILDELPTEPVPEPAPRPLQDMVEEMLELVRGLARQSSNPIYWYSRDWARANAQETGVELVPVTKFMELLSRVKRETHATGATIGLTPDGRIQITMPDWKPKAVSEPQQDIFEPDLPGTDSPQDETEADR